MVVFARFRTCNNNSKHSSGEIIVESYTRGGCSINNGGGGSITFRSGDNCRGLFVPCRFRRTGVSMFCVLLILIIVENGWGASDMMDVV